MNSVFLDPSIAYPSWGWREPWLRLANVTQFPPDDGRCSTSIPLFPFLLALRVVILQKVAASPFFKKGLPLVINGIYPYDKKWICAGKKKSLCREQRFVIPEPRWFCWNKPMISRSIVIRACCCNFDNINEASGRHFCRNSYPSFFLLFFCLGPNLKDADSLHISPSKLQVFPSGELCLGPRPRRGPFRLQTGLAKKVTCPAALRLPRWPMGPN